MATRQQIHTFVQAKNLAGIILQIKRWHDVAKDLGCTVGYTKLNKLGSIKDRIVQAKDRCKGIGKLQDTSENKALKIQMSVWPTAFFGVEAFL